MTNSNYTLTDGFVTTSTLSTGILTGLNYTLSTMNQFIPTPKNKDEEITEKLKRILLFRDLKIVSVKDLGAGYIEITLIRGEIEFKIKINGKLVLESKEGTILNELGEILKEPQWEVYEPVTTILPNWVTNISSGTTLSLDTTYSGNTTLGGNYLESSSTVIK